MHVVSEETVNRSKIVINLHVKLVLKEMKKAREIGEMVNRGKKLYNGH